MKISQRVTGMAAFIQGTMLAVLLVFVVILLPRLGIGGADLFTAAKILPAIHSPVLLLFYVLFLIGGVTLVLIVLGMKDQMQGRERTLMQVATVTAVAGLAGYGSFAMVGILMVTTAGQQSDAAAYVASTLSSLHVLLTIAPVAAVMTTALWGWAAARTRALPAALCYIVIGASLMRLVTLFNQLPILVLLQLGGSAVWGWWLGIALLRRRSSHAALGARATA